MNNITKPIFVLFHGFGSSRLWFEYGYLGTDKLKKLNFINELKKIGDVYSMQSNFFNIDYYFRNENKTERQKWIKIYKKYNPHTNDIDFNLEDLDYDVICKKVYDELINKFGIINDKTLVPICHSYGSDIGIMFSKMYKNKCSFCVLLDGNPHALDLQKEIYNKFEKKNKKMVDNKFNNNVKLNKILNKIKNSKDTDIVNKEIRNVFKMISHNSDVYKIKHFIKILPIKTLFFRSIYVDSTKAPNENWNNWAVREQEYVTKTNNSHNFKFMFFVNAPHFLWYDQKVSDEIISQIKQMIESFEKS